MFKKSFAFLFAFFLILNVVGCTQTESENNITVKELKEKMAKEPENIVVLDVRTPGELTGPLGQIDGVINIPVQELKSRVDELEKYKDKEIEVICRSGNRSQVGTKILLENGYNANNVLGGMKAYRADEN